MTKQTWFDAFFDAVTSSPEFKWVAEKDWAWNFKKGLKNMEKEIKKASTITDSFKDTFATDEAMEAWNNYKPTNQKLNKTWDQEEKTNPINIKYFEKKNHETWGFNWVAWMNELKANLKENFIKPLKFKFLVKNLEKQEWKKLVFI